MRRRALVAALLCAVPVAGAPRHPPPPPRRLERRSLTLTDAQDVPVVHVARGVPTTVTFGQPLRRESILLADPSESFLSPKATDSTVVLIATRDLAPGAVATLTVTLADGTLVPLLLQSVPKAADLAVDVAVSLGKKAPPESVSGLKAAVLQLLGELDECRGDAGAAGVSKLARLILEADGKDAAPIVRQEVHRRDKQDRVLVEVVRAYRLFGLTYVVLTLENRDPSAPWAFGKAELAMGTGRTSMDVAVLAAEMDIPVIAPNETGRLVLAFRTPASGTVTLQLLERNGTRNVRLEGLAL